MLDCFVYSTVFHFDINFCSSITDWIQTLTGIAGTSLLVYTLYLQSKATQAQADVLKLEEDRDRRGLLPIFEVSTSKYKLAGYENFITIIFTLTRNDAYDVIIGPIANEIIEFGNFHTKNLWKPEEEHTIRMEWKNKGGLSNDSRKGPLTAIIGKIYFYDASRRPYSQIIRTSGHSIYLDLAMVITDEERSKVVFNPHDLK